MPERAEREWIPVATGMPNPMVHVEVSYRFGVSSGEGWRDTAGTWRDGPDLANNRKIAPPAFWRPLAKPTTREVGRTAADKPVMLTEAPSHYVLEMEIEGRRTRWVDMATVQRLRTAIADLLVMIRVDGLVPDHVSYMQEADKAVASSPAE